MKKLIFGMMLVGLSIFPMHSGAPDPKKECADSHLEWVAKSLTEMYTIRLGMTRRQLKTVFTEEGGTFNRVGRTYVYRNCETFKVTVQFRPVGNLDSHKEGPEDVITDISRPFLAWGIID